MSRLEAAQRAFAAHLRDPDAAPPPADVEPRRMAIYRELFFNNVASLLAGTLPLCRAILGDERWRRLVRGFYATHRAHTPYFLELPAEFVQWLQGRAAAPPDEPPFLAELAHYEWVELALEVHEAEPDCSGVDPDGDLLAGAPVVSPLAWPLAYRWPVPRLSVDYQPVEPPPQPTFVVVHRDATGAVHFLEVTPLVARLLELADAMPEASGAALLACIAAESRHPDPVALGAAGAAALADLRRRGIVLGVRAAPS